MAKFHGTHFLRGSMSKRLIMRFLKATSIIKSRKSTEMLFFGLLFRILRHLI